MADEDVEMKRRFIAQARLLADNVWWVCDHLVPISFLWTFHPLANRKHGVRVTSALAGRGRLDPGWWVQRGIRRPP